MLVFNNLKEMENYYWKNNNTYVFADSVVFDFDLSVDANIIARDINAGTIRAKDIQGRDIIAHNIDADNIFYNAICVAYKDFACQSIKGERKNAKHFSLDKEIVMKPKPKKQKTYNVVLTEDELMKLKELLKE